MRSSSRAFSISLKWLDGSLNSTTSTAARFLSRAWCYKWLPPLNPMWSNVATQCHRGAYIQRVRGSCNVKARWLSERTQVKMQAHEFTVLGVTWRRSNGTKYPERPTRSSLSPAAYESMLSYFGCEDTANESVVCIILFIKNWHAISIRSQIYPLIPGIHYNFE